MKSKQVLSIEQMKHLLELGLDTSDASMCWIKDSEGNRFLNVNDEYCYEMSHLSPVPTYTLQDIIELLPHSISPIPDAGTFYLNLYYYDLSWVAEYLNNEGDGSYFAAVSDNIIVAAYEMLCWCIENGYVGKEGE